MRLLSSVALLLLASCASNSSPGPERKQMVTEAKAPAQSAPAGDYSTWGEETIALPPDFAPEMKLKGEEKLLFAPGMFKAGASDFFSYVFVLRYPNDAVTTTQLLSLLEHYYRGLMTAVAQDKNYDMQAVRTVQVILTDERESILQLEVQTFDAFVTGVDITLHMRIETQSIGEGSCIVAQVAPDSAHAEVWPLLAGAAASLSCSSDG